MYMYKLADVKLQTGFIHTKITLAFKIARFCKISSKFYYIFFHFSFRFYIVFEVDSRRVVTLPQLGKNGNEKKIEEQRKCRKIYIRKLTLSGNIGTEKIKDENDKEKGHDKTTRQKLSKNKV